MWAGRLGYNFRGGSSLFIFIFWKINLLKKNNNIGPEGPSPHLCLSLAQRNQKENKNKTRLITIQQCKSQSAKTLDGKLKNKDETY